MYYRGSTRRDALSYSSLSLLFIVIGICRSHDPSNKKPLDHFGQSEKDRGIEAQMSDLRTQLGAALNRIVSVDNRLNALDHRMNALDQRVISLGERLQDAIEVNNAGDIVELKPSSDFAGKWNEEKQNDESADVSHSWHDKGKEKDIPFRLTRVTREDTGHVYIVRLHYRSSTLPTLLLKIASYPIQVQHADLGLATVYIPKEAGLSHQPWVYFLFAEQYFSVGLNLISQPDSMDLPLTTLKISEGSDVIFERGHDARLHFAFHVEGNVENVIESESADLQFLTKSSERPQTVVRSHLFYDDSGLFTNSAKDLRLDLVNVEGSRGYLRGTVMINSSNMNAEGVLEAFITLRFNCSVSCLVRQMTQQHHVHVYREGHPGPFPEGFVGFVRDDYKSHPTHILCDLNPHAAPCAIVCEAAGDRILSVGIEKFEEGSGSEGGGGNSSAPAHARHLSAGNGGYWGCAMLAFEKLGPEDAGDYVCSAMSQSAVVTQRMTLVVRQAENRPDQ